MVLSPLTMLTGKNLKFEWTNECQTAFLIMKKIMPQDVLLMYTLSMVNVSMYILTVLTTKSVPLFLRTEN